LARVWGGVRPSRNEKARVPAKGRGRWWLLRSVLVGHHQRQRGLRVVHVERGANRDELHQLGAVLWFCWLSAMEFASAIFYIPFFIDSSLLQSRQLPSQSTKLKSVQIFFSYFDPQNSRKLIFPATGCGFFTFVMGLFLGGKHFAFKKIAEAAK
jgi:hypothetical protein